MSVMITGWAPKTVRTFDTTSAPAEAATRIRMGSHARRISLINFPDALVLLRLHDIGFSVTGVILAYVGYNLVYSLLSYPAGAVADKLGPHRVIGVGMLVFGVAYAGLGLTRSHVLAAVLIGVYGVFTAFTDGVGKAWVSSLLPNQRQGTGQGVFEAAAEDGKWAIGVDSDQATIVESADPKQAARILTSMMKNVDNSLFRGIKLHLEGKAPYGKAEALGLAEGGVGLAHNKYYDQNTPAEVKKLVDEAEQKIIKGEIKVDTAFK